MARCNRPKATEGILDFASRLPWWLSVALAVISYLVLRAVATSPLPVIESSRDVGIAFLPIAIRGVATALQYVLPLLLVVAAIFSGIQSSRQRKISEQGLSMPGPEKASSVNDAPSCPKCNALMVKRRARRGDNAGEIFWGCTNYPDCKGTRPLS